MNNAPTKVCVGEPGAFSGTEIDGFVALVLAGGEVSPAGLRDLVVAASQLAFARTQACLVGVGGLKRPRDSYRGRIEQSSGTNLDAEKFPYELGWVFVLPSARGRRLSGEICTPLLRFAGVGGVFATSDTKNQAMHKTLARLGFERAGKEWRSRENEGHLALFVRHAV